MQDQTSAGSSLMSIGQLPAALSGVGSIDVIDFDMCLMGGYETLAMLHGLASYAVFSEELEPGEGNPHRQILDGIHRIQCQPFRILANQFHVASVTLSRHT